MALLNIKFEGDRGFIEGKFEEIFDMAKAKHLLREAVDDIADAIEQQVQRTVPVGETGELKLHPLDREDTRIGVVEPRVFLFARGGGVGTPGIRGAGGQIVGAAPGGLGAGELVARSVLTVAREPKHAIFVHDGTGVFQPGGSGKPITTNPPGRFMKFTWQGKRFRLKSVKGQPAQPYLENAFLLIDGTYVPARIELLRAQIAAAT